ncbi:hypothetical protein BDB00DRAFT_853203 [Zychaea mexicana]|uniref:uncharacterized protein n=1 Tax=Zychaea mexicana TaxID=64656 RepID=UPI0022FE7750|nr:uncharacterized protein BDB00DRAFT_853203 [Zychaea mexicana]KAI9484839.1 hypothetical protein BDB00DRAFT_853203 [Zychaea mexicana]
MIKVAARRAGLRAHYLVCNVYFDLSTLVISLLSVFSTFTLPHGWQVYALLILISICGFFTSTFMSRGFQLAPAGPGAMMRMISIVLAFIVGAAFFHEYQDQWSIIGAILICSATGILLLTSSSSSNSSTHRNSSRGIFEQSNNEEEV